MKKTKTKMMLSASTIRVLSEGALAAIHGQLIKESCDPANPCMPPPPTALPTYMGCPSVGASCCC